jgi:hypothetical protein
VIERRTAFDVIEFALPLAWLEIATRDAVVALRNHALNLELAAGAKPAK